MQIKYLLLEKWIFLKIESIKIFYKSLNLKYYFIKTPVHFFFQRKIFFLKTMKNLTLRLFAIYLACTSILYVKADKSSCFTELANVVNESLSLISSNYKSTVIFCLSQCNLNISCLTATYNKITTECSLYSRYFNSSEMQPSNSSRMYKKKGNCTYINLMQK